MLPSRLSRLPEVSPGVLVANGLRARLLGLAALRELPPGCALLIPRCSCVHTFGMRFALDLIFLDDDGTVVQEVRGVPPRRLVRCRGARAVVERPAAQGEPTSADKR